MISDQLWEKIKDKLPGSGLKQGRPCEDNRKFINAVFWILRTGAPWRDLPPDYGDLKNTHRRFCRWRDKGVWEKLLEAVTDEPDCERIVADASYVKRRMHSAEAHRGNQTMSVSKGDQLQDTFGRGCAWYAAPSCCCGRCCCGLHAAH